MEIECLPRSLLFSGDCFQASCEVGIRWFAWFGLRKWNIVGIGCTGSTFALFTDYGWCSDIYAILFVLFSLVWSYHRLHGRCLSGWVATYPRYCFSSSDGVGRLLGGFVFVACDDCLHFHMGCLDDCSFGVLGCDMTNTMIGENILARQLGRVVWGTAQTNSLD